jgi:hypothetical protein
VTESAGPRSKQVAPSEIRLASVSGGRPSAGELLIAGTAVALFLLLLLARTAELMAADPAFDFPADHHIYRWMAEHAVGSFHVAPWCWRLLGPAIAGALPLPTATAFQIVTFVSLLVAGVATYATARVLGFGTMLSAVGVLMFLSLGYAVKFNVFDFWLADPLAFAFVAVASLLIVLRHDLGFAICIAVGVLAKESVIFTLALYYGFRAERPIDLKVAIRTIAVALPAIAVLVGVRVAIPAQNGDATYLATLPTPIRSNARTVPSYDVVTLIRQMLARRDWIDTTIRTVSAFGVTVGLLGFLGAVTARRLLVRAAPYLALVALQLLFALNTQRLVVLAFPVVILLALEGMRWLMDVRGVSALPLIGLVLTTYVLTLVNLRAWEPNVFAQAAVFAGFVGWAVIMRRRAPSGQAS